MKTKHWIMIFSAILIICAADTVFLWHDDGEGSVVGVFEDGELIYSIDISTVDEDYEYRIETEYGFNVLSISSEGVSITDADCRDRTCVKHGRLRGGSPIICLPHKIVVRWLSEDQSGIDAVTGTLLK